MRINPDGPSRQRGFLLVEVMLALSILVLVVLGVYKILQATIVATAEVRRSHQREQQVNGVLTLLRQTFGGLPADARLTSRISPDGSSNFAELVIEQSPTAFAMGPAALHFGAGVLSMRQQIGGLHTLSLLFEEELSATGEPLRTNDPVPPPLPLLKDLSSIEWRFYDGRTARWVEQWDEPSVRPSLIQLNLGIAGHAAPVVAAFRIPPITVNARPPGTGGTGFGDSNRQGDSSDPPATPPPVVGQSFAQPDGQKGSP